MDVWEQCLRQLKGELTSAEFNTWISPLQARVDGFQLHLFAPNRFVLDWARNHYEKRLLELCTLFSEGIVLRITFEVGGLKPDSSERVGHDQPISMSRRP